ncbi:hypothetical protein FOA52_007133 [Chlamydomonas sp. UWO 241]|nr:hypothetical protein FOA52_007133 [Chlamydomonas sp. UWO 241]
MPHIALTPIPSNWQSSLLPRIDTDNSGGEMSASNSDGAHLLSRIDSLDFSWRAMPQQLHQWRDGTRSGNGDRVLSIQSNAR